MLLQFPFSFHRTIETAAYLTALLKRFADYPLAVELRHDSWDDPEIFALLCEYNSAFCNIDQPIIGQSLSPFDAQSPCRRDRLGGPRLATSGCTGGGTTRGSARTRRFRPTNATTIFIPPKNSLRGRTGSNTPGNTTRLVFAITNNHYLGKGVVNALQLISMLKGAKVNVPEPLRQHYPELEKIASMPPERPTLFPIGK